MSPTVVFGGKLISSYNNTDNTISINAEDMLVVDILKRIELQTAVNFFSETDILTKINYKAKSIPLEKAIKQVTHGLNTAISYTEISTNSSEENKFIISEVRILQNPDSNGENAREIMSPESSTAAYANTTHTQNTNDKFEGVTSDNYDYIQTRWLTSLAKLPLDHREKIENTLRKYKNTLSTFKGKLETQRQLISQQRESLSKQVSANETALLNKNPDRYRLRESRLEKIKETIRQEQTL